jgi:hypothetical protein
MPLTPDFTTSQQAGLPSNVIITDTSTGSDINIVERVVFLVDYAGNYVVPTGTTTNYVLWPLAQSSISINCLTQDTALQITVNWVDAGGVTLNTKTILSGFTLYNETFYYSLTQGQAAVGNPSYILQDNQFFQNKSKLRVLIDSGDQAITLGYDITSAQECYDLATAMVTNQNIYF